MKGIQEIRMQKHEGQEQIIKKIHIDWKKDLDLIVEIAFSLEPNFKFTEKNVKIFDLFMLYFTGHDTFASSFSRLKVELGGNPKEGSLNKGLCLIGNVGVGKTLIFDIFKEYTKRKRVNSFIKRDALGIVSEVNVNGIDTLNDYSNNDQDDKPRPMTLYIDDLGSSNEIVTHFGSKINVMSDLISLRYNVYSQHKKLTHMSTNLYAKDLKDKYGERIIDRMKELFNIIELGGESFRK